MKAVLIKAYGPAENLYIGDWEKPTPKPNELLVKVHATALNRADIMQRKGQYPPPSGESPILGLEIAGEVVETGQSVFQYSKGDKICGLVGGGGYAEYAVIPESLALPLPKKFTFEQSAAIPEVFLTAFQALQWIAKLKEEEHVLIHAGASGVGTAAIQIAADLQAKIIVTASASKHDVCRKLGARETIDYKSVDFEKVVKEWTEEKGVNVIIDFIGEPYLQKNLNILARDGRLVMLALMGGYKLTELNILPVLFNRLQIFGSTLRSRSLEYKSRLTQELYGYAWPKFEEGVFEPIVDRVFDWTEVAEAHRYMEANKNVGKIILKIA